MDWNINQRHNGDEVWQVDSNGKEIEGTRTKMMPVQLAPPGYWFCTFCGMTHPNTRAWCGCRRESSE